MQWCEKNQSKYKCNFFFISDYNNHGLNAIYHHHCLLAVHSLVFTLLINEGMPGERPCIVGAVLLQQPSKRPLMDKFFKVNRVLHTSYVGVLLLYILGMSPSFWFISKAKLFSTRQFVTFKVGELSLYVSNFVLVKNSWYMIQPY